MAKSGGKIHYPNEEKSGEVKRLKGQIRSLEHEIKRLKSELKTYEKAFNSNLVFLKTKTKQFNLDELLEGAKAELTLEQIAETKRDTFEEMKRRWLCYQCGEGILKLIIVPNNRYFRKCSICSKRTEVKEYLEGEQPKGIE